jgi:hypothetical protein
MMRTLDGRDWTWEKRALSNREIRTIHHWTTGLFIFNQNPCAFSKNELWEISCA